MKKLFAIMCFLVTFTALTGFCQQSDFTRRLQQKLSAYSQQTIPLKIHLTFNQPAYSPGDTAYFKAHFFTADMFQPIGGRQIIQVQLVNPSGETIRQDRILVVDGSGTSQLFIHESDPPGIYTVVAYSNAEKAEGPALFFQCPLIVSGPQQFVAQTENQSLAFHPEGGHFISGITNKVVISGPPNATGNIISSDGKKVAPFSLDQLGMGVVIFVPAQSSEYFAELPEENLKVKLPAPESDGVGILASVPNNKLPIRITLQVAPNSALKRETLHFALTSHETVYFSAQLSFEQRDFLNLSVPQDNIPEGIAVLSVFKEDGSVVAGRLVFIRNASPPQAKIDLGAGTFSIRDKIAATLTLTNSDGHPVASKLVATVYQDGSSKTGNAAGRSITDNALLYGDLQGCWEAGPPVRSQRESDLSHLDNFLISQKWVRYRWEDVWNEKPSTQTFRKYLHLEGRAYRRGGGGLPDSTLLTFLFQKNVTTYEAYAGESGSFDFPLLFDFYGEEEFFFRAESKGKVLRDVVIELDAGIPFPGKVPVVKTAVLDAYFAHALQRNLIDRSYSYHLRTLSYAEAPSLNALVEEEIFGADITIDFDDYFLFPTMSETIREIIPMIQHRKSKGRDVVRLYYDDRNHFAEEQPLFIIDGIITDHTTYFLSLKPSEVASVKVIYSYDKLKAFGAIGRNGIVLVETKIPNHQESIPRSENAFMAQGLVKPSAYHQGVPPMTDDRIPNLRTNLLWSPSLQTDRSGTVDFSFNASDVPGVYRIRIEGFTAEGEPVSAEDTFEVVFQPD